MSRADMASEMFREGQACSQAVLAAWAPSYGVEARRAVQLASGFAAGMRLGDVCGAVTGAFMVLGLALAGEECVTREGRAGVATAVAAFAERFRDRVGALDCPTIIGCDLRTPEGAATANAEGLFATRCAPAVRAAAEILEDMLGET